MAWINILAVPGLTYTLTYYDNSSPITPSAPLDVGGGFFDIDTSDYDFVELHITDYGTAVVPASMRVVLTDGVFGVDNATNPYGCGGDMDSASSVTPPGTVGSMPSDQTVTQTTASEYVQVGSGYFGGGYYATSGSFVVEIDTVLVAPEFWQDFAGTYEDVELHKPTDLVFHPFVPSTPYRPASTYCLPDYPESPPGPGYCPGVNLCGPPQHSGPPTVDGPVPLGEPCVNTGSSICCRIDGVVVCA